MSKQDIEKRLGFAAQGVKAEMAASFEDRQRAAGYKWQVRYTKQLGKTDSNNAMEIDETLAFATESAARKWADTMIKKGWYKGTSGTPEKVLTAKVVPFARPGTKAKMALTIYTVGAKNACYEALANLKALAQLASETNSGWDFHVTVMTDHVKDAIARMETKPTQAATDLDKAVDTLGMLKKIEPKRLNDIQKGSLKQLIGYVAKSLRDARANIKVVTTASRPGVKTKFGRFSTEFEFLANQIKNQPDLAKKNIIVLAKKMGKEVDITRAEFEQLMQYAAKLGMETQVANAHDDVRPGFARAGAKAKMAKRMVVDTITSGNQKHELGYESVTQSLTAGEPPHEWFRPIIRTTNLDTGKSSEKASQPHYTEKSARDWLKNYASSVKPSTDPLYAEYASNREKISKMMTRLAQARNNPELRQKLQAESDKLDARQREVAAQLQKRKSSRPGAKAAFAASDIIVKKDGQYIYYYPEDDDRATFPDDNGKGAYTVKSNRTGKPVSAKTYRSFQEAAAASNEMNEKLPPLKKAKASRPGAKAKMAIRAGNFVKFKYIVAPGDKEFRGKVVRIEGKYAIVDFGITTPAYQEWVQPGQMTRRILVDELVTASRPGAKASVDFDLAESCWEGYEAVGTKKKDGKTVPNCVPKKKASRPGAKAKFATEVGRKGNKSAMISRDATGTWYAYVVQRIETGIGKEEDMLGTMRSYSTEDRAKRAAIKALDTSGFSRPGVKAKFEKEYVLWGLPKGETDAIHQQVLSTQAKTPAQMEDVKKRAAAAGWHSFRVQILDLSKPYKGFSRPGAKAKA